MSDNPLHKVVLDEVMRHDIGCTCDMCTAIRTRFPSADASDPDTFAGQGGDHEPYPFDATNTVQLQSIAKSMLGISSALGRSANALESIRDILRGRDDAGAMVKGPIRAIADFILRVPQQPEQQSGSPQTKRTPPVQQQLPLQQPTQAPAIATQAPPFAQPAKAKRIATDAEMQQMIANLSKFTPKIRFDKPNQWPGESQKGRKVLVVNGTGNVGTEVDPAYLEIYADSLDYFAGKAKEKVATGTATDGDKKDAQYGELEAARCRRIAQCVREGTIQFVTQPPAYAGNDDYG